MGEVLAVEVQAAQVAVEHGVALFAGDDLGYAADAAGILGLRLLKEREDLFVILVQNAPVTLPLDLGAGAADEAAAVGVDLEVGKTVEAGAQGAFLGRKVGHFRGELGLARFGLDEVRQARRLAGDADAPLA